MRVILDTNILISALIASGSPPARLVNAWLDGRFTLVSHGLQIEEFREVSRREKITALIRPSRAGRLINRIAAIAEMPVQLPPVERSRDPRDDFLLALCEAGNADRLVTGDKDDLLVLRRHAGAVIVTATALADQLGI